MAKTRLRAKVIKKASSMAKRRLKPSGNDPTDLNVLAKIVIKKTGDVDKPESIVSFRNGPADWLIHNLSDDDHTVTIDPSKFKPVNPLATNDLLKIPVKGKDKGVIISLIGPYADEIEYTYEIEITNK